MFGGFHVDGYISISRIKKTACMFIQIWLYSEYMQHCSPGTFQFCQVLNVAVTSLHHAMELQKYKLILLTVNPSPAPSYT